MLVFFGDRADPFKFVLFTRLADGWGKGVRNDLDVALSVLYAIIGA
ncbi:hypothetical protein [Streptomyces puniciscabiei]